MKELLENISTRERGFLGVGVTLAVFFLLYFLIIEPIGKGFAKYKTEVPKKRETLVWMQTARREVVKLMAAGTGTQKGKSYSSPLVTIEKTAKQWKLDTSLKRVEPEGENNVKVWIEEAIFDDLVLWLQLLRNEYHIDVASINVDKKDATGYVDARITFVEAGT